MTELLSCWIQFLLFFLCKICKLASTSSSSSWSFSVVFKDSACCGAHLRLLKGLVDWSDSAETDSSPSPGSCPAGARHFQHPTRGAVCADALTDVPNRLLQPSSWARHTFGSVARRSDSASLLNSKGTILTRTIVTYWSQAATASAN